MQANIKIQQLVSILAPYQKYSMNLIFLLMLDLNLNFTLVQHPSGHLHA